MKYICAMQGPRVAGLAFALVLASTYAQPYTAHAQTDLMSSTVWCADTATWCWEPDWRVMSGIRAIADVRAGLAFDLYDYLKDDDLLAQLLRAPVIGAELPLYEGWLALNVTYVPPFSVAVDPQANILLANTESAIYVAGGFTVGIAGFGGMLEAGVMVLFFDNGSFEEAIGATGTAGIYLNFQILSLVRLFRAQASAQAQSDEGEGDDDDDDDETEGNDAPANTE